MFRKAFLKKKPSGGCQDIHHFCTVHFLADDAEPLTVTFQKDTKGLELFDQVCTSLNLLEKHFFGLRYVDSEKQKRWLDHTKPAYRQLKHVTPAILRFRVKHYPSNPENLKEEITKYFLFLQLRRDLHHGRLICTMDQAINLAAYIAQSEIGDCDQDSSLQLISQLKHLPKEARDHEREIAEAHAFLKGHSPSEVEATFLKIVSQLEMYGVDPYIVLDETASQCQLGITHLGVMTFKGTERTHLFKWAQIAKLGYEGKNFIVQVTVNNDPKKRMAYSFKCPSLNICRCMWKCAIEQQYFYNLQSGSRAPRVTSGGGLFRRHSTFRFSGQSETEAFSESSKISRTTPSFRRSTASLPYLSNYGSLRAGSLPEDYWASRPSDDSSMSEVSTVHLVGQDLSDHETSPSHILDLGLTNFSIPEESPSTPPDSPDVDDVPTPLLPCAAEVTTPCHAEAPNSVETEDHLESNSVDASHHRADDPPSDSHAFSGKSDLMLMDAVPTHKFVLLLVILLVIAVVFLCKVDVSDLPPVEHLHLNYYLPLRALIGSLFAQW